MLFNSVTFAVFFAAFYVLYLAGRRSRVLQNVLLLLGGYLFYGWWDWRFLSLLWISTISDYFFGLAIHGAETEGRRLGLVRLAVTIQLALLGVFKYFDFFATSAQHVLQSLGLQVQPLLLHVALPVGISFYTFQSMTYTIDIHRRKLEPTRSFLDFGVFVSFFPQLVAGPIERARNLIPQIAAPRRITVAQVDAGLFLLLWGYFKKIVVADNLAPIANQVFNHCTQYHGLDLALAVLAFTFQIYCDFSGYSDIARGLAKLLGFELTINFKLPYFARTPSEFWQRWHISLSTWLRDYLYIPLGGNRHGRARTYRNLLLTMLLGGLWHGAAWNFVICGGFHGLRLCIYRLIEERRPAERPPDGSLRALGAFGEWLLLFALVNVSWVFFRCQSVPQITYVLSHLGPGCSPGTLSLAARVAFYTWPLVAMQLYQHVTGDLLALARWRPAWRVVPYAFLLLWLFVFGAREAVQFIYFQF
ncbi:MAG: MBOAT family protein [Armatimonadetes bacterium]|nr:MBOAT family protein [Armatimonadota bacterium]